MKSLCRSAGFSLSTLSGGAVQALAGPRTATTLALLCGPDPAAWSQPGQTAADHRRLCFSVMKGITSQLISVNPEILIGSLMPLLFAE